MVGIAVSNVGGVADSDLVLDLIADTVVVTVGGVLNSDVGVLLGECSDCIVQNACRAAPMEW